MTSTYSNIKLGYNESGIIIKYNIDKEYNH